MAPTCANGKICDLEIPATDLARSVKFYQAAFGWQVRKRADGSTAFDDGVGEVRGAWLSAVVAVKASAQYACLARYAPYAL